MCLVGHCVYWAHDILLPQFSQLLYEIDIFMSCDKKEREI